MTNWPTVTVATWVALLLAFGFGPTLGAEGQPDSPSLQRGPVLVILRSAVGVESRLVLVGDVAWVRGGDSRLRERVAALDLAAPPQPGRPLLVSRQQVAFRIQLAGLDREQFQVQGPQMTKVTLAECQISPQELVEAARKAVRQRLPSPGPDVELTVAQQPSSSVRVPGVSKERVRVQASTARWSPSAGRVRVPVLVYAGDVLKSRQYVTLDVRLFQQVPVARRLIKAGEALSPSNVTFDRRPVTGSGLYPTAEQTYGRRARRTLRPLEVVRVTDLQQPKTDRPVLIRPRQIVQLVARKGPLRVSARGQSLEAGRAGDLIRVRNTDSRVVVVGRVVSGQVVEVPF